MQADAQPCAPRCFCGWLLSNAEEGFRCARCGRIYDSTATLPACKHPQAERGADGVVSCRNCPVAWREAET